MLKSFILFLILIFSIVFTSDAQSNLSKSKKAKKNITSNNNKKDSPKKKSSNKKKKPIKKQTEKNRSTPKRQVGNSKVIIKKSVFPRDIEKQTRMEQTKKNIHQLVQQCDKNFEENIKAKVDAKVNEIKNSPDYLYFKSACEGRSMSWNSPKGPGDSCILHTTNIAAKLFDFDFPLSKCMIIAETGAIENSIKQITNMFKLDNVDSQTKEIKTNASHGNGNGLGQITPRSFRQVMKTIDPEVLKVEDRHGPTFNCEARKKFNAFFKLVNENNIPDYNIDTPLKELHPLLSLAISMTYISVSVPVLLKYEKALPETIRYDYLKLNAYTRERTERERRIKQISLKYNSSKVHKIDYANKVADCVRKVEVPFVKALNALDNLRPGRINITEEFGSNK